MAKLITVRNYAAQENKTTQWAYNQIKQNKVKHQEIDGVKFIVLDINQRIK
jgi:hypothetical protein